MKTDRQQTKIEGGPSEQSTERRLQVVNTPADPSNFYPKRTDEQMLSEALRRVDISRSRKIPAAVSNIDVDIERAVFAGRSFARLHISFTQPNDPNFAGARIWIKGYGTGNVLGDPDVTLAQAETLPFNVHATVSKSPATILLENTQEEIIVGVESFNSELVGAGTTNAMPRKQLLLDYTGQL